MTSPRRSRRHPNVLIGAATHLALAGFVGLGPDAFPAPLDGWHTAEGYRWQSVAPPPGTRTGFTLIAPIQGTGIPFTNHVSAAAALNNQILENGAGVALGDVDGDGLCDVYLCGSEPSNALYRNRGNWRFDDTTAEARVACTGQFSTGATFADVDGDSDLDLLVNGLGVGTRLFRNDGRGRFTEELRSGLIRRHGATSLALADVDGDGDLDLYVATYRVISARSEVPPPKVEVRRVQGRNVVTPADRFLVFPLTDGNVELAEKGDPDHFYLNDGTGTFREVSWTAGMFLDETGRPLAAPPEDWGLSVLFRDLTGDGFPDLYVCNDFFRSRDQFWIHDRQGHFRPAPAQAWRNMSLSSMAADAADIDRDGHDDLLVAEMLSLDHGTRHRQRANAFRPQQALPFSDPGYRPELPRNTLFLARGDGSFAEIAAFAGLAASDWSWNVAFLDIDLDGFEDVLFATGNAHDVLDLDAQSMLDRASASGPTQSLGFYPPLRQHPLAFRNNGNLTFTENSQSWGLGMTGIAQGMALGDLDNDGDLDVVMNRLHDGALLLRNDSAAPRVAVRLRGLAPNTRGIGARIRLVGGKVPQSQEIIAGGRYLSADEALRTFAASTEPAPLRIEVTWRSGRRSTLPAVSPNRIYEIEEPTTTPAPLEPAPPPSRPPLFTDASALLRHQHVNPAPPDFSRQPLLPRALNHLGPGIAWIDSNLDGWEDLVIAGGPDQPPTLSLNHQGLRFPPPPNPVWAPTGTTETLALVPWRGSSSSALLASRTSFSSPAPPGSPETNAVQIINLASLATLSALATPDSSPGPIAVADVDSDGDLDVFVGGRHVPGRYPAPALSRIFLNQDGRLVPDDSQDRALREAGLVSGAAFTDLDGDGTPDLALACEWGPVRVFRNQKGRFVEATRSLALDSWTGCWAGIAAGDFDEDGRPDLIASNLGLNTHHQIPGPATWRLYALDSDQDGTLEIIEAYRPTGSAEFLPWRTLDVLGSVFPAWKTQFSTYRSFGGASMGSLLSGQTTPAFQVESRTFEHRLFLNRGDRFEPRPLPANAQFAPGFSIALADFDGDGHLDAFLAQNTFDLDLDSGRADAGTGLCLLGDGHGAFRPLSPAESGIALHGEQRAAAVADFDHDGRADLCVTQNNGITALFRNTGGGGAGTRIRLQGASANPHGIGAALRSIVDGKAVGPVREITAGSGYLSSDAPTLVIPSREQASVLEVRWPGGRKTRHPVPPHACELTVQP